MLSEQHLPQATLTRIQNELPKRLPSLRGKKLLIVGDIGLDEYVMGDVRRISPEAPVPVVEVNQQDCRLGLAANVAQNVASLGGQPLLVGVVGEDASAAQLREMLKEAGVAADHLLVDTDRPTTRKLRVMAGPHHIVRVDFEHRRFLSDDKERELLTRLERLIPEADGVIIEDYAKGLLSEAGCQSIIQLGRKTGTKVMVDPHPTTPLRYYQGADLLTPNRDEAVALTGESFDEWRERRDFLLHVGQKFLEKVQARHLVLTRGKEGMSLFDSGRVIHLPTYARQVFDVTGAGDTVIAALALAWVSGFSLEDACILANFAAGVVVGKVGCVPCYPDELVEYIQSHAD